MSLRRIPLTPYPDYTQQTELDGITYAFRFRWSTRGQCWHMDLRTLEGAPVAISVRLVSGWSLLRRVGPAAPYAPGGRLYMFDLTGADADPTFAEFGTRFGLFYIEAADLAAAAAAGA